MSIVRSNFSGQKILVKDIAKVIDGSEKETQREYFYKPQKNKAYELHPSTSLSLMKSMKADTITLIASIKKTLEEFKNNLNKEYKILIGFNEGENTKKKVNQCDQQWLDRSSNHLYCVFSFPSLPCGLYGQLEPPFISPWYFFHSPNYRSKF